MTAETSKRHQWSSQEDVRLKLLIEQYGTAWAKISNHLPGRDAQSCKNRLVDTNRIVHYYSISLRHYTFFF